jgi:hypothetical protein
VISYDLHSGPEVFALFPIAENTQGTSSWVGTPSVRSDASRIKGSKCTMLLKRQRSIEKYYNPSPGGRVAHP